MNALQGSPDFLMFSGDETHTTDDPAVRRQRMKEFKGIIGGLNVGTVRFLPGEHDSALDNGQAYREAFGDLYYTFDVKGVHFIALDNVSSGNATLGDAQIAWLKNVLAGFDPGSQIIVFAHRPLLDVYPQWDWRTRDGAQALALLSTFKNVTLFYGHIHQLRTDSNGWFTQVNTATKQVSVTEYPITPSATSMAPAAGAAPAAVPAAVSTPADGASIQIVAQRSRFTPNVIHVRRNVPVTLELTSLDTKHGFSCPDLNVEAVIVPGTPTRVALTASRPGEYGFACDIFCGDGHEDMVGRIIVE